MTQGRWTLVTGEEARSRPRTQTGSVTKYYSPLSSPKGPSISLKSTSSPCPG